MTKLSTCIVLHAIFCVAAAGQTIKVHPTGVNVNSQNPTVVFLTFGQIPVGYTPAEAVWCGSLILSPPPALGSQCRSDTIYGALPARFNLSQASGTLGMTDIMAIPPAVVRRAYQAAASGGDAGFFYVRRFVSSTGQPDQFVNVTCRMTGGGARVPFALTNVEIKTDKQEPILFLRSGEHFPKTVANIQYNGTGTLKGRWELVQPGEEEPQAFDLLTEATLPFERRGTQRSFTEVARFNHFLPPVGKFTLPLEPPGKLPILAEGRYLLLLRIEVVDDKEGDSSLTAVGVGSGVLNTGAVAAFPLPTLKFFVGGADARSQWEQTGLLLPTLNQDPTKPIAFHWSSYAGSAYYRLEILDSQETQVFAALLSTVDTSYRVPTWFQPAEISKLRWRVSALNEKGEKLAATVARKLSP